MGVEFGSNNQEVQDREIQLARERQNEQNEAEHRRLGEVLDSKSTIDNEGERKQISPEADSDRLKENTSKLEDNRSIEDDANKEQAENHQNEDIFQNTLENQRDAEYNKGEPTDAGVRNEDINSQNDASDSIPEKDKTHENQLVQNGNTGAEVNDNKTERYVSSNPETADKVKEINASYYERAGELARNNPDERAVLSEDGKHLTDKKETGEEVKLKEDKEDNEKLKNPENNGETDNSEQSVKKLGEIQDKINQYYSECNEIGKNPDMSPSEKVDAMQEKFKNLGDGNRGDAQCIASYKYLNENKPFGDDGRANVDYPNNQGFNIEEGKYPEAISRDNPMQESVDRYGFSGGKYVAGIENGEPASFDSRALPYVENPESYHVYDVDNGRYCDAVDIVKNCDPDNIEPTTNDINNMIDSINEEQGLDLDHVDSDDIKDMIAHYKDYQNNLAKEFPEMPLEDASYGLSGEAAPWDTESGERLSEGGADQKWLPLSADDFEKMGIFKER